MVGKDDEDALGCLAARLTHSGIPAVLAMTYSVLVKTTEQLFGKFYGELAGGESLGVALAKARQDLYFEQKRGKRWRGTEQIDLKLADWFLPAWYQAGGDIQLLATMDDAVNSVADEAAGLARLPKLQEEGFFGRSRELWFIERAFVRGTRRLTIAGFGGQGKTYLAIEAGRWLVQTGMFEVVCFVDYASFQGVDAVGYGVSVLGVALEQSLLDAAAVTGVLHQRRTLVILDNLESLAAVALGELLTVAKGWSEAGQSRLLLTTRDGAISHADYPLAHSLQHQLLALRGFGEEDALDYFQCLMMLPPMPEWDLPKRGALLELFKLVDFHPLSIRLVALQLKERRIGDLAKSLELLLKDGQGGLVASLNLSLERLASELAELLPRLGVFQGGAFEPHLLQVTQIAPEQWTGLQAVLVRTGLVQVTNSGIPFLRFHPILAPVLWDRLTTTQQQTLRQQHQEFYYELVSYLYHFDGQQPEVARLIVKQELPNLLWAVQGALVDQSANAVDFVDSVNKFLNNFGLKRDREFLTAQLDQLIGVVSSNNWYLVRSNQGKQLFDAGQYEAAAQVFAEILQELDTTQSFDRVNTLNYLSRCLRNLGALPQAEECLRTGISLSEQLEQSEDVKRQWGSLKADLGDVLTCLGEYASAQQAYQGSLVIKKEIGDQRGAALAEFQLGTLAMLQNDLATATQQYQSALQTFQQFQEPDNEAKIWHQLGMVYGKGKQWAESDRAYRASASIKEQQGNFTGAAGTYNQLANLNVEMNQLKAAEDWYLKALKNFRAGGDRLNEAKTLSNLANLLAQQPDRLSAAQQRAEEALAIKQTLDQAAATIWTTYDILAKIATAQGKTPSAQAYRQQARSAKAAFAGTQYELQQHEPLITAVVTAVADQSAAEQLETLLTNRNENGWGQLVAAIRRILAGERSIEALWDDLDADDSMIIQAIIDRLAVKK
jgi:tetratricopeptide (TPR) repeat protein